MKRRSSARTWLELGFRVRVRVRVRVRIGVGVGVAVRVRVLAHLSALRVDLDEPHARTAAAQDLVRVRVG